MNKLPDYSDKRFLVVDDEPFIMKTINRMLRLCGAVHIATAQDGAMALRILNDDPEVDCIISDCNMKPVNGLQLLQAIRTGVNRFVPRHQPFLMLTGHGDSDIVQTASQLDVSGYVVKPMAMDRLARGISRAIEQTIKPKDAKAYQAVRLPKVQGVFQDCSTPPALTLAPSHNANAILKERLEALQNEGVLLDGEPGLRLQNRRLRRIYELADGDVLDQDIEAATGAILLRRGSCLNKAIIHRLRAIATETQANHAIWVGDRVA